MTAPDAERGAGPRIDKWLWFARFFKSRALARQVCAAGRVRVNRQPAIKPHYRVRLGDVLTFPQGDAIRVVRVRAFGERRGPAPEARTLYEDLTPPAARDSRTSAAAERPAGAGRPTKSDRRAIDRLHDTG